MTSAKEGFISKVKRNLKNGTLMQNTVGATLKRGKRWWIVSDKTVFLNKSRRLMRAYLADIPMVDEHHFEVGNYYLDARVPLNESSIVYSLGILNFIDFDLEMVEKFGCEVHMFDPAPVAIAFMKTQTENRKLRFQPIGVWTEKKTFKFYHSSTGSSPSMINRSTDKFFLADCHTISAIMEDLGHQKIDVFKADIEGAALPIIQKMIDDDILPVQIVAEFERPTDNSSKAQGDFYRALTKVRQQLRQKGYREYQLPRDLAKYNSAELLFVAN